MHDGLGIMSALLRHLEITFFAVGLAILIGVPLGIIISKRLSLAKPVLTVAGIFQTVPSLALFGLIIPFLGIGFLPSIVVLFLYALLPIITNTYIGITGINPNHIESARGIGMNKKEILFKVELPQSVPVIMGGIKVSAVTCVGTATIAALIGAGGLGSFIFRGIANGDSNKILMGAIPAALLAIVINWIFGLIERALTPQKSSTNIDWVHRNKRVVLLLGLIVFSLPLIFFFAESYQAWREKSNTIVVGHKAFAEQRIIGEMYGLIIDKNTDYNVNVLEFGGTMVIFEALNSGEIMVYPEYTGTAYGSILGINDLIASDKVYGLVKKQLADKYGLEMMPTMGFNDTYAFVAKPDFIKKYNVKTISDMKDISGIIRVAGDNEFLDRADGMPGVEKTYGFRFDNTATMDAGLMITSLVNDSVDVAIAYSTDGRIGKFGLKLIEDNKKFFPPYQIGAMVPEGFAEKYPRAYQELLKLRGMITESEMQQLNLKVLDGAEPKDVAREYLLAHKLIPEE